MIKSHNGNIGEYTLNDVALILKKATEYKYKKIFFEKNIEVQHETEFSSAQIILKHIRGNGCLLSLNFSGATEDLGNSTFSCVIGRDRSTAYKMRPSDGAAKKYYHPTFLYVYEKNSDEDLKKFIDEIIEICEF